MILNYHFDVIIISVYTDLNNFVFLFRYNLPVRSSLPCVGRQQVPGRLHSVRRTHLAEGPAHQGSRDLSRGLGQRLRVPAPVSAHSRSEIPAPGSAVCRVHVLPRVPVGGANPRLSVQSVRGLGRVRLLPCRPVATRECSVSILRRILNRDGS